LTKIKAKTTSPISGFWGPSGMIYLFDPQLRLTLFDYNSMKFKVALEAPGFAVDVGKVADIIPELASIRERTIYPDITGQFRVDGDWGHLQVAGVARWISFDNPLGIDGFPSGTLFGGGINVSGTLKTFGDDALHAQVAYRHSDRRALRASDQNCGQDRQSGPRLFRGKDSAADGLAVRRIYR
jgi:hypothetical protein